MPITNSQLVDMIRNNRQPTLMKDVFFASLENIPDNYRKELIRVAHLKYVHEGRFVQCVDTRTGQTYTYQDVQDAVKFIRENINPRVDVQNVYKVLNGHQQTTCKFIFKWVEDKELI